MPTKIEWAQETENPFRQLIEAEMNGWHCTKISEGCLHCYAEKINFRFGNGLPYDDRNVKFVLDRKVLDRVLRYRKPRRLFWQSMGDLFHEGIPDELILEVLAVMRETPQHRHIVLTKRPERMKALMALAFPGGVPRHIWPGVTAENQARADERIPVLLSIPAAVHFVSVEPMLGPVDLGKYLSIEYYAGEEKPLNAIPEGLTYRPARLRPALSWVIVGAETGPGRRTMLPRWARDVKDQCVAAGVAFFLKQMYRNEGTLWKLPRLDGQIWNQYPNNERNPNA